MTPIGGKSITQMSIDADNDHVSSYGDIACYIHLTVYYYQCSGRAVLIVVILEEKEERVGRQFNTVLRSWNLWLKSVV